MYAQPMFRSQFRRQRVNCQVRLRRDPALHPISDTSQFTVAGIALRLWRKRTGLTLKPHHIVHKFDRNTQPPSRFGVRATLFDKRNGAFSQLNRMRFTHL